MEQTSALVEEGAVPASTCPIVDLANAAEDDSTDNYKRSDFAAALVDSEDSWKGCYYDHVQSAAWAVPESVDCLNSWGH